MKSLFADQQDIEVVGESGDFEEILELVTRLRPTVVIIDALAHDLDTDLLTQRIFERASGFVGILILANDDQGMISTLKSGANGILLKRSDTAQLVSAVKMVAKGYYLLPPPADESATPQPASVSHMRQPAKQRLEQLTERELDVFRLVSYGWSNAEIARDIDLRESTVKSYIRNILVKLELRDRVHVVIFAHQAGMFPGSSSPHPVRAKIAAHDSA